MSKTIIKSIRFNEGELRYLKKKAEVQHRNLSDSIRQELLKGVKNSGKRLMESFDYE